MTTLSGSCPCGRIQIVIPTPPKDTLSICHCTSCRKASGGTGSPALRVAPDDVQVDRSLMQIFDQKGGLSGKKYLRSFCPSCGAGIFDDLEAEPGVLYVRAGLFPPGSLPPPSMELFVRNLEEWEKPYPTSKLYETQP